MKHSRIWMQWARNACACNEQHLCTIKDGDPKLLHKRLSAQARRMGWAGYSFAQDSKGGVVVCYKGEKVV